MWFQFIFTLCVFLLLFKYGEPLCRWGDDKAHCDHWGSCSHPCGGGRKSRECTSCVWRIPKREHDDCNEFCYNGGHYSGGCHCSVWRAGRCCEICRHIYIPNCVSGRQTCGGTPDGIKCDLCVQQYYSAGYNKGCRECPKIEHCARRSCSSPQNTICEECENEKIFFRKTTQNKRCERLCSYNKHTCWPGTCSQDYAKNCQCAPGFTLVHSDMETSCQPTIKPVIQTCETVIVGSNGEMKRHPSSSKSTACEFLQDVYGNYIPVSAKIDTMSSFQLNTSGLHEPIYIVANDTLFGLTDSTVNITKRPVTGPNIQLIHRKLLEDTSSSTRTNLSFASRLSLNVTTSLNDGDFLCVTYEAKGGGYFKSNIYTNGTTSSPIPYRKTTEKKELCYRYDNTSPSHCANFRTCSIEPIQLPYRITREALHNITFTDWFDPIPVGGTSKQASGIESYEIRVNEVIPSLDISKVDYTHNVFVQKVNSSVTDMLLNLTSKDPRLFCITLEVKDVADNVRQSRRFMLHDNSSFIDIHHDKYLYTSSASSQTNFTWQTHHHEVCLSWKGRFYNQFYINNKLLNPIEKNEMITGVFEQLEGSLPVSGTPNIYGIRETLISWSVNYKPLTPEVTVPQFLNQTFCNHYELHDGDTFTFQVRPIDIAENTVSENVTVHIDRSSPHINNIWLQKDGYRTLFVHHSKDLSSMKLTFHALDPHSGILNIKWAFGTTDSEADLTTGVLKSDKVVSKTACPATDNCYCPNIGHCEFMNYTIPLNKLVEANKHEGNHNRAYYFSITAINYALLSNTEHIDILVDDSPPEVGVVYEGPPEEFDIDYTSDDSFMVHWHGFIDHESGIHSYRVGMSDRCLGAQELYEYSPNSTFDYYEEVLPSESSTRIPANFTGRRFISVIALNNALSVSKPVCTDGITRDLSPPKVRNITIEHATWSESIFCHLGQAWLFHPSLAKVALRNHSNCHNLCHNDLNELPLALVFPTKNIENDDLDVSGFMCANLRKYTSETIIYLPNDHLVMSWDVEESGSQVLDYEVGIGTDPSSSKTPDIVDFKSTKRREEYKRQHEGIGSNEIFYIFLKALNKAGIYEISTIGPVLIDETPPLNKSVPNIEITDTEVICGWENDTFFDLEQEEPISSIFFQLGNGDTSASPIRQWKLESSEPCPSYSGGCFTVPLRRIQAQDTDLGLDFFFTLFVYNNAGHFITVRTELFRLPSRFPPGHAVVENIDPDKSKGVHVTNVHFTPSILCVRWNGFKHHQKIALQIGVGTNNNTDNVVPFSRMQNVSENCITSENITYNKVYYVILQATCSGGVTLSSSDGVIIIDSLKSSKSLSVKINNCETMKAINYSVVISNNSHSTITFESDIGSSFKMHFLDDQLKFTNVHTFNGTLHTDNADDGRMFKFLSFVEKPVIHINTSSENLQGKVHITCDPYQNFVARSDSITSFWYYEDHIERKVTFEVALKHSLNKTLSDIEDIDNVVPFRRVNQHHTYTFDGLNLKPSGWYVIAVRQCTSARCLEPITSKYFQVDISSPTGNIKQMMLKTNGNCVNVTFNWTEFVSKSTVLLYQWAICKGIDESKPLTQWSTVVANSSRGYYEVSTCVDGALHSQSTRSICIRTVSESGRKSVVCDILELNNTSLSDNSAVYDFDISSTSWDIIKDAISSSRLGDMIVTVHENELDFGTTETKVAGFLLYATNRNVTWYLRTSSVTPFHECERDDYCISSTTNSEGFVTFKSEILAQNIKYYTCAKSDVTTVERELFTETLNTVESCSNGFILDDTPPLPGELRVKNTNGFIAKTSGIYLSWDDFYENVDAAELGYSYRMLNYRYAVGTCGTCDDVLNYVDVGLKTRVIIPYLSVKDGERIFFHVNGTDHAGYSATASSKMMIVDTSAPTIGHLIIDTGIPTHRRNHIVSSNTATIRLVGFQDMESGILHFEIGLGSVKGISDIEHYIVFQGESIQINTLDLGLEDGRTYYINAKALNRAGLYSALYTEVFMVDKSPPNGGHVMDRWSNVKIDTDYQTDVGSIRGDWKGFTDVHSGIKHYMVGLGTEPYQDDVETFVNVGKANTTEWKGAFTTGRRYYITVKACNGAGLCTMRCSDGTILDHSPPVPGIVTVGSRDYHQKYHPRRSSIHIQWAGFEDPQSDIDRYETCIGSAPQKCDIVPMKNCHLRSNSILTGLKLPKLTNMFATVVAYNRVGMRTYRSSDSFRIDDTPPSCSIQPAFDLDYTSFHGMNGQWDKSMVRFHWRFVDSESPIVKHEVMLRTHHEGHTPIEHMRLGAEQNLTISLEGKDWLNNGEKYRVVVTSCNLAGLCSNEESADLLIDSTPPHMGGFKPPMTWNNFNDSDGNIYSSAVINWYGFNDKESGIARYFITADQTYSGTELSGGINVINVSETKKSYSAHLNFTKPLQANDVIILTIWAQNNVGLNSSVARVTVNALSTTDSQNIDELKGLFDLEKHSCDVHYCDKTCTCAVVGKPCIDVKTNITCKQITDLNEAAIAPIVRVQGGLLRNTYDVTSSSACLSASWTVDQTNITASKIERFEWSMGLYKQPVGEGIFDLKSEIPWHDIGHRNEVVHCLPINRTLLHGQQYVIYVKAWYAHDVYALHESAPVTVDRTPPSTRRGRNVTDSNEDCAGDMDVFEWSDSITACWTGVFNEQHSKIIYYTVSLGTWSHADDVVQNVNVGLQTRFKLENISIANGTEYFFTVAGYNNLGLFSSVTSDGFLIDAGKPQAGVLYNTLSFKNVRFQPPTHPLAFSWHGFQDYFSGIRSYHVKVVSKPSGQNTEYIDVGMRTKFTFDNLTLTHGETYYGFVYAIDNAGMASDIAKSTGVTIDATPPTGLIWQGYNLLHFENASVEKRNKEVSFYEDLVKTSLYKFVGNVDTDDKGVEIVVHIGHRSLELPLIVNHDGTIEFEYVFFAENSGSERIIFEINSEPSMQFTVSMLQCKDITIEDNDNVVTAQQISHSVVMVTMLVEDTESTLKRVYIGAGKTYGGFQIQALTRTDPSNHIGAVVANFEHGLPVHVTVLVENHAGLESVYHSKPVLIDHTAPNVSNVQCDILRHAEIVNKTQENETVVGIKWNVGDPESIIKYCTCSADVIGDDYERFTWRAQTMESCYTTSISPRHGDIVRASVKCVNSVELATEITVNSNPASFQEPNAESATLMFITHNRQAGFGSFKNHRNKYVQSNNTVVTFTWNGFYDVSGIESYEYRLLYENSDYIDWTVVHDKNMISENNVKLRNGVYKAEVRAINSGRYKSDIVSSTILVQENSPHLSGQPITVVRVNGVLHIDWEDVFQIDSRIHVSFDLLIGTRRGYSDIIDIEGITDHKYEFKLPESTIISQNPTEIYIKVGCVYATGLWTLYDYQYML